MSDTTKTSANAPAKSRVPRNWPVLLASALCLSFIIGVWANNYRVTQAANAAAAAAAAKK